MLHAQLPSNKRRLHRRIYHECLKGRPRERYAIPLIAFSPVFTRSQLTYLCVSLNFGSRGTKIHFKIRLAEFRLKFSMLSRLYLAEQMSGDNKHIRFKMYSLIEVRVQRVAIYISTH